METTNDHSASPAVNPLADRVVVELDTTAEDAGLSEELHAMGCRQLATGRVVAVGDGHDVGGSVVPLKVRVDDVVLLEADAGTEVRDLTATYRVLPESGVILVLDRADPRRTRAAHLTVHR